jgi:hypothetical protein
VWTSGFPFGYPKAAATLDRLMHHGEAIVIRGAAYSTKYHTAE